MGQGGFWPGGRQVVSAPGGRQVGLGPGGEVAKQEAPGGRRFPALLAMQPPGTFWSMQVGSNLVPLARLPQIGIRTLASGLSQIGCNLAKDIQCGFAPNLVIVRC